MELNTRVYELLEPEEKEHLIIQLNLHKLEEECGQFGNCVILPVFKKIQEEFGRYGRSVLISPGTFSIIPPGITPKLRITVSRGRIFIYRVQIMLKGNKLWIERHLSIGKESGIPQVIKTSIPLPNDPSRISEEYLRRDITGLYQRHIKMNKITVRYGE